MYTLCNHRRLKKITYCPGVSVNDTPRCSLRLIFYNSDDYLYKIRGIYEVHQLSGMGIALVGPGLQAQASLQAPMYTTHVIESCKCTNLVVK